MSFAARIVAAHAVIAVIQATALDARALLAVLVVVARLDRGPLEAGVGVELAALPDAFAIAGALAVRALVSAGVPALAGRTGLRLAAGHRGAPVQARVVVELPALAVAVGHALPLTLRALISTAALAHPVHAGLAVSAGGQGAPLEAGVAVEVAAQHACVLLQAGASDVARSGTVVDAAVSANTANAGLVRSASGSAGAAVRRVIFKVGARPIAQGHAGAEVAKAVAIGDAAGDEHGDEHSSEDQPGTHVQAPSVVGRRNASADTHCLSTRRAMYGDV